MVRLLCVVVLVSLAETAVGHADIARAESDECRDAKTNLENAILFNKSDPGEASEKYLQKMKLSLERCVASRDERVAKEKAKLEAEDKARQKAELARQQDDEANYEAIRNDKTLMSAIFGASLCTYKDRRAAYLAEVAKEKKYARIGGMVNKVKLYNLQLAVRRMDEKEAEERKTMRDYKGLVPQPCSAIAVKRLRACRGDVDHKNQPCYSDDNIMRATSMVPPQTDDDDDEQ